MGIELIRLVTERMFVSVLCFALLCGISELTTERATGPVEKAIQINIWQSAAYPLVCPQFYKNTYTLAVICYPNLCQLFLSSPPTPS